MLCQIILPSTETSTLSTFPQSFHDLRETLKSKLNLTPPSSTLTLKYRDSDDELVVLNSEEDLQTAILTLKSEEMTTLKVNVNYQEENSNLNLKKNSSDGTSLERSRAELSLRNISSAPFSENLDGKTNLPVKMPSFDPLGTKVNKPANKNIKGLFSGLTGRLKSQEEQNFDISKSTPLFGAVNRRNEPICSECQEQIQGVKYMCLDCSKYRCCEACEAKVEHAHPLLKVRDSMNQSANIETKYRYSYSSMFGTPEKRENRGQRLSFSKGSGEKKTVYAGKVFLDNTRDQVIKTCPYQEEKVVVVVKNNGSETWPKNVKLSCVNGFYRNKEESLFSLEQGEKQNVTLYLRAPCKADKYLSQWRLTYTEEGKSKSFGESLFIELHVEENNTISKQKSLPCEEKVSTNLVRRAKTLTEAFLKRNEEQGKSQRENNDKRAEVAKWLNEVFPGDLKEKIEFLDSCGYKGNEEDMSRIVGLYLQSLIKVRTDGKEKAQKDFMKGEEICA